MPGTGTDGVGDGGVQQTFRGTDVQCREVVQGRQIRVIPEEESIEESIKNNEDGGPTGGPILLK